MQPYINPFDAGRFLYQAGYSIYHSKILRVPKTRKIYGIAYLLCPDRKQPNIGKLAENEIHEKGKIIFKTKAQIKREI